MAAVLLALAAPGALASVVLNGTRVVYPESEREVTLKVTNEGDTPSLVQAWIDDGDANASPEEAKSPFTLTPPLFRLDPKKGQTLRIIHLQQPLPGDRESLFWLNVLDVPPVASGGTAQQNSLQFAFRTRIKLLFRPAGLPGDASSAPARVAWRLVRKDDGRQVLTALNPTPYHITYTRVEATARGHVYAVDAGAMAKPGATVEFPIDGTHPASGEPDEVHYTFINDFGAAVTGTHRKRPAAPAVTGQ
ncbi:pili assembly chaperone [Cupriavidus sp. U2]|uniref:fimbria/pilus periplasmic chaperone n=1 Tax=Cupriavidus sp. U2 TaxID=2920269 RepID=UPI001E400F63|nr:fimbria/pilus periplasmic chaperone [Cupriavidus sp. U2]KAI3592590.1 pili assembly chaperone [Cupriavidus sp. U2]